MTKEDKNPFKNDMSEDILQNCMLDILNFELCVEGHSR